MSQPRSETSWSRTNFAQVALSPGPVAAAVIAAGAHVGVLAAVDEQRVAGLDVHALRLRDLLQLPAVHRPIRRDVRFAPVARHVEEHALGDDAVLPGVDRAPGGTLRRHADVRVAAPPHPVDVPHVTERVDVRDGLAVVDEADVVDAGAGAVRTRALADEVLLRLEHPAHRDPAAVADEAGRRRALLRCDEVDGALLIVVSPAAPVAEIPVPRFDLRLGRHAPFRRLGAGGRCRCGRVRLPDVAFQELRRREGVARQRFAGVSSGRGGCARRARDSRSGRRRADRRQKPSS